MQFSLNEIQTMAKLASRGAGLAWGLAEEAGKAVRWLNAHGLPGPETLVDLLTRNDAVNYGELAPVSDEGVWHARAGLLCPLCSGAALCDRTRELVAGRALALGPTAHPLLLAPFAAGAAELSNVAIELSWNSVVVTCTSQGCAIRGDEAALRASHVDRVRCRRAEKIPAVLCTWTPRHTVDAGSWTQLGDLAHRTFAPATDFSRIAGAGAGLTDND